MLTFINKEELNTDTYTNMDESEKHYSKCNKPNTEGYVLYDL